MNIVVKTKIIFPHPDIYVRALINLAKPVIWSAGGLGHEIYSHMSMSDK